MLCFLYIMRVGNNRASGVRWNFAGCNSDLTLKWPQLKLWFPVVATEQICLLLPALHVHQQVYIQYTDHFLFFSKARYVEEEGWGGGMGRVDEAAGHFWYE